MKKICSPILLAYFVVFSLIFFEVNWIGKEEVQRRVEKMQEEQRIRDIENENIQLKRINNALRCNPFYEDGDPLLLPPLCRADMTLTQPYGKTDYEHAYGGMGLSGHPGIDYGADEGTPVRATHSGVVFFVKDDHDNAVEGKVGYGNNIKLRHRDGQRGYETVYAHLHDVYVQEGQEVRRGEIIGTVGDTGFSSRPHLHFGIRFLWYCDDSEDTGKPCEVLDGGNRLRGWVDPSPYL